MSESKHDEIAQFPTGHATSNTVTQSLNVTLSVPQTIEIKMVDASTLSDYELWFFITSLCFGAFTGFVVPFIQSLSGTIDKALGAFSGFLLLLTIVSLVSTLVKRNKLTQKSKTIPLKVSEAG